MEKAFENISKIDPKSTPNRPGSAQESAKSGLELIPRGILETIANQSSFCGVPWGAPCFPKCCLGKWICLGPRWFSAFRFETVPGLILASIWHHFWPHFGIILISFLWFFWRCFKTRFRTHFCNFSYHIPEVKINDFLHRGGRNHVFEVPQKRDRQDLKMMWNWCQNDAFSHAKTRKNINDCALLFWMPFGHHFWCFFNAFSIDFSLKKQEKH